MRGSRLIEALAVIIGLAGEGLLVWLLSSLPLWAQLCLYIPVGVAILVGLVLAFRQGRHTRQRLAAARDRAAGRTSPERPSPSRTKPPPPPRNGRG